MTATDIGFFVDSASPVVASISVSDSASGADSLALVTTIRINETGVFADSASLTASVSAADSGTGIETGIISFALAETGVANDSNTFFGFIVSDSGSAVDSYALAASVTTADTATGIESSSPGLSSTDSGVGTETASISAILPSAADAASGSDSASISLSVADSGSPVYDADSNTILGVASSDSGSLVDSSVALVFENPADSAMAAETTLVSLSLSNSALANDSANLSATASSFDAGSGVDAGAFVSLAANDAASGVDLLALVAALNSVDSAAGVDFAVIGTALAETGTGNDTFLVVGIASAESGSGAESWSATIASSDNGSAFDNLDLHVLQAISDTGVGSDSASVTASIPGLDSGVGAETGLVAAAILASESRVGVDASIIGFFSTDSGVFSDLGQQLPFNPVAANEIGLGSEILLMAVDQFPTVNMNPPIESTPVPLVASAPLE